MGGALLAWGLHRVDPYGSPWSTSMATARSCRLARDPGSGDQPDGLDLLLAEYRLRRFDRESAAGQDARRRGRCHRCRRPPGEAGRHGPSIGSVFALEAVSRFPTIAGLILESAIADPMERILLRVDPNEPDGSREDVAATEERLDHQAKIGAFAGPTLILHTRVDGLLDDGRALRLKKWAAGDTTLRLFDAGDHSSILWENTDDISRPWPTSSSRSGPATDHSGVAARHQAPAPNIVYAALHGPSCRMSDVAPFARLALCNALAARDALSVHLPLA